MATFDDLKKKAMDAADVIADVSVDLYKKAEAKTKELARMAKLQADNASDRTTIKKLYLQIGRAYYETHKQFPAEEFEQSCAEITTLFDQIDVRKAELDAIKASRTETADDDFEDAEATECSDESCDCGCEDEEPDESE